MQRPLKVLFIPALYPTIERPVPGIFIREHAEAVSYYNEVTVFYSEESMCSLKPWVIVSDKKEKDIRTIRVKTNKLPFFKLICYNSLYRKLVREKREPDIIHAHIFKSAFTAGMLGIIYKKPVILSEHLSIFPRHLLSFKDVLKVKFSNRLIKLILPVSRNLGKAIRSYKIGTPMSVVYNTVDTVLFSPSSLNTSRQVKTLLCVALICPIKNIPLLLHAMSRIKKERHDFVLNIVGDGEYYEHCKKLACQLKLASKINFLGLKSKQEIAQLMRTSDFFVLPSLWENLPCVLIEALASGLPVIATKVGGIPEIIDEEKTGLIVPPGDLNAMTQAIRYMLDNHSKFSREKISLHASKKFSYDSVGKKLNTIYNQVISGQSNLLNEI